ncbi:MAG: tRNA-dihydrouridine synthase family protein [Planctomycetota bacterium]
MSDETIEGRAAPPLAPPLAAGLPFTAVGLLAPMEGVTDPAFRDVVLAEYRPEELGGAFTEFARVTDRPLAIEALARHLGPRRFGMPVGLQLMGNDLAAMAETARHAVAAGAPLVDINFGCPSRSPFAGCVGSALLEDPARIERIVRAVVDAVPGEVVTAKIRSGVKDDRRLEEVARATEAGGARMLTIHCRTRTEAYRDDAIDWRRIARAVAAVGIPVCGNGGAAGPGDVTRMRDETGCAFVMIGRAALGDPWVFTGRRVGAPEAAAFLLRYADAMRAAGGSPGRVAGRIKQLLNYWSAGDLVGDDRRAWLRETEPERLLSRLAAIRAAG